MSIIVKSQHIEITNALKSYATKKFEKLNEKFENVLSADINLIIEPTSAESDRNICTAVIKTTTVTITAKESSDTMYTSIDLLYEKCLKQLRRTKEKQKERKGNTSSDGHQISTSSKVSVSKKKAVKQRYNPKPIDSEDAAAILNDENLNFLVYRDLQETICVIYKTEDGGVDFIHTN
jgi:putative sigma-54 modulation protein